MTTKTEIATIAASIAFAALPALLQPLADGTFAGITTRPDGVHCAVVLLGVAPNGESYSYEQAKDFAESLGGQRPTKAVWSLLHVTCRDLIPANWYWADEPQGSSYAWYCYFSIGGFNCDFRSSEAGAVAVRLIPLTT